MYNHISDIGWKKIQDLVKKNKNEKNSIFSWFLTFSSNTRLLGHLRGKKSRTKCPYWWKWILQPCINYIERFQLICWNSEFGLMRRFSQIWTKVASVRFSNSPSDTPKKKKSRKWIEMVKNDQISAYLLKVKP